MSQYTQCVYWDVVCHAKREPTHKLAHLVFADTRARTKKNRVILEKRENYEYRNNNKGIITSFNF